MPGFDELPLEIISKIYEYLDYKDLKEAQLTCYQWFNACQFVEFERKTILKLTSLSESVRSLFSHSFRKFTNIHLINLADSFNQEELILFFSMESVKNNIKSLILENFDQILLSTLCKMLGLLSNLSELIFIESSIINSERILCPKERTRFLKISELISNTISPKLESFSLRATLTYGNLKLFTRIKNLKKINIELNKYENDCPNSNLYEIIKNNEKSLKHLSLKMSRRNQYFLKSLLLLSNLKLEVFSLTFKFNWIGIVDFFNKQNLITSLTLIDSKLNDEDMIEILKSLKYLERLNLQDSRKLTSVTMLQIGTLKNLKYLNINNVTGFHSHSIINGLTKNVNYNIIELKCSQISLKDEAYIRISENLPNLQTLHCGSETLTDISVQSIISNCKNLTDLSIFHSCKVTDYGLTGIDLKTQIKIGYCISELDKLISLNLRKCSQITDKTLIHGLKFKNLTRLYLPACFSYFPALPWLKIRKSPLAGFKICTENCPKIKELNLLGCSGNKNLDEVIEIIMENLTDLQRMTISRNCERVLIGQEAFLIKRRKDLSKIRFFCRCEICFNIKILCENFVK